MCLPCRSDTETRCHIRSDSQHVSAMAALEVFINCPFVAPLLLQHSSPQQEHINGKSNPILVIICTWLTLQTWQFPDFSPDQGARAGLHPAARSASLGTSYLDEATAEPGGLTAPRALCYEALHTLQHCRVQHWVPPALREQQGNVPIPALPAVLLLVFLPRGTASTQWACKFLHPGSALCCSERCLGLRGTTSPGHLRVPWLRGSGTATCPGLHWISVTCCWFLPGIVLQEKILVEIKGGSFLAGIL